MNPFGLRSRGSWLLLALTLVGLAGSSPHADELRVTLGPPLVVTDLAVPGFEFRPDGHIPLLPDEDVFQMYLAGHVTYRLLTDRVTSLILEPTTPVIGPGPPGSFDNNGAWLYSVFRKQGDELIGFYHAEDSEWPDDPDEDFIAWKSMALATSSDNGFSWTKQGQLLTSSQPKPTFPTWGGNGDFSVVYDDVRQRWTVFFADHFLRMAVSNHPDAVPGSWFKLGPGGAFAQPGLGGTSGPIPGLALHPGGNPSVHFNTHVGKWIMVWHSWQGSSPSEESLWLSTSPDLLAWDAPILLVAPDTAQARVWYPTIAGSSDTQAGQIADLTYAYFPDRASSTRNFVTRKIRFDVLGGVGGSKLVLGAGSDPTRRTLRVRSESSIDLGKGNGSADDPVAGVQSSLRIRTATGCDGPCDTTYPLAGEWRYLGAAGMDRGYRYRDAGGVIKNIRVRPGRGIRIVAKGALEPDLSSSPQPVDVVLRMAGKHYCMSFGGESTFKALKRLHAKNSPAPEECPDQ